MTSCRIELGDPERGGYIARKVSGTRKQIFAAAKALVRDQGWRHPNECVQIRCSTKRGERRIAWVCKDRVRFGGTRKKKR